MIALEDRRLPPMIVGEAIGELPPGTQQRSLDAQIVIEREDIDADAILGEIRHPG